MCDYCSYFNFEYLQFGAILLHTLRPAVAKGCPFCVRMFLNWRTLGVIVIPIGCLDFVANLSHSGEVFENEL